MSDVKVPEQLVNVNVSKDNWFTVHIFSVDALVGDPSRTITKMEGKAVFVSPAREQQSNSEQTGSSSVPFAIWKGTAGL